MADRELSSAPPWSQGQAQPGGRRRPPRGRGLQTTSMSVCVSSDEPPVALLRALCQLVRVADLTTVQESEVERGSWFRSWRLRENQSGALGKVARLARKAERAGELRYIYGARAEATSTRPTPSRP